MSGLLEVLDGGIANSIQDLGRFGVRHMGIAVSGALDPVLARCANALVGNAPDCACLEVRAVGPTLIVRHGRVRVALAGELDAQVRRGSGSVQALSAWSSLTLFPGDVIEVGYLAAGTAYLAITGGICVPSQLGSRSTYPRARIGGIDGELLSAGHLLPCASETHHAHREFHGQPWRYPDTPVRVMLGPQAEHFTPASVARFLAEEFVVTPNQDRMGVRLEGTPLEHVSKAAADIVSDGVTPGTVQVPGNGQPIILLADCQTVGGYPKIATVISADLYRLAQWQPGQRVRFAAVDLADAHLALAEREAQWAAWVAGIAFGLPNPQALYNDLSSVWTDDDESDAGNTIATLTTEKSA